MTIGEKLKRTRMFSLCYVTKTRVPTGKRTTLITQQNKENHLTSIKNHAGSTP